MRDYERVLRETDRRRRLTSRENGSAYHGGHLVLCASKEKVLCHHLPVSATPRPIEEDGTASAFRCNRTLCWSPWKGTVLLVMHAGVPVTDYDQAGTSDDCCSDGMCVYSFRGLFRSLCATQLSRINRFFFSGMSLKKLDLGDHEVSNRRQYTTDQLKILVDYYEIKEQEMKIKKEAAEAGLTAAEIAKYIANNVKSTKIPDNDTLVNITLESPMVKRRQVSGGRIRYSEDQKALLRGLLVKSPYPGKEDVLMTANDAGVTEKQVRKWLENHRSEVTQKTKKPLKRSASARAAPTARGAPSARAVSSARAAATKVVHLPVVVQHTPVKKITTLMTRQQCEALVRKVDAVTKKMKVRRTGSEMPKKNVPAAPRAKEASRRYVSQPASRKVDLGDHSTTNRRRFTPQQLTILETLRLTTDKNPTEQQMKAAAKEARLSFAQVKKYVTNHNYKERIRSVH
uniref:Homeobox domain-containing protein n=1 Tax=Steinernema glaseri TaxID=37863 RepID=A0A1I7ZQS8_9BILA